MSGDNFRVPPLSWDKIAEKSIQFRAGLGLADVACCPVMNILELALEKLLPDFTFQIGDDEDMDGAEGHTHPSGSFIKLHERVYRAAWEGDGRARFTAAHEIGHLMLHTNTVLMRVAPGEYVAPFRLAEQQANQFAAELLMPRRFIKSWDGEGDLMMRFQVSWEAAYYRLEFMRRRFLIL